MTISHPRLVQLLGCDSPDQLPDPTTINSLRTIAPILVPLSNKDVLLGSLPSRGVDLYLFDDLQQSAHHSDQLSDNREVGQDEGNLVRERVRTIIDSLDSGLFIRVVTDLWDQLIESGVGQERIIRRIDLFSSEQKNQNSNNVEEEDFEKDCDLMLAFGENGNVSSEILVEQFLLKHNQRSKDSKTFILNTPGHDFEDSLISKLKTKNDYRLVPVFGPGLLSKPDGLDQLIDFYISSLRSDRPDGLFSTSVVASSPSSTLLGQVYSSTDSIRMSIKTGRATYFSRSRNQIWIKGQTSGSTQELLRIRTDCDGDSLEFQVVQKPLTGFCHTQEISCFGPLGGFSGLESTLIKRLNSSVPGSYTNRLFSDEKLLKAKIMEEAEELCDAEEKVDVASEMADLIYFGLCRCISKGVSLGDVEDVLNRRSLKITRRKGDSKRKWADQIEKKSSRVRLQESQQRPSDDGTDGELLRCRVFDFSQTTPSQQTELLKRPIFDSQTMLDRVKPILDMVKSKGDIGLIEAVQKFDRLKDQVPDSLVINSPFKESLISAEVKRAIDVAYENIFKFHLKQLEKEKKPMVVETMKGVVCSRFARPIDRVGLYIPGGSATLPSTALMLGIPAQVAGCEFVSMATPARADGTISPEIMYIASKCGVKQIIKAGGAHGIASLAYGTESVQKVDKIFGPGNQFVTTAKMIVASDLEAKVAIDMPAGPSEVLVIADKWCNPKFVAADLLSQAEHGPDSQVILIAINFDEALIEKVQKEIEEQARKLTRVSIIEKSISKSLIIRVKTTEEAFDISNDYGPEHLIIQLKEDQHQFSRESNGSEDDVSQRNGFINLVKNAGSVFIGDYSPESCGDYASGTNHSLPTSGYAKQYSGVSTLGFMKHITTQELSLEGLKGLSKSVITLAEVEGLDGHANSVRVRLN
ncbi:histidinol dehydrogenase [Phakopsora pachyrhizi]|uniref:Histidine biosynthesis trifunctional protein n=1 Tax=Phakopsora pachyrhizi TaxID=170000 RepID=A0AAV0BCF0_PHAPC|nr:histidinol dehydrogenase [Phakopsora pachyrhizi]KAI8450502.1 histidinol dehydrogenase [Phakopsora pachyrhizi]CAH7682944.1 histidinol dehydrogenase [Phakopsora pachyrhizi]CAH7683552.1 histidinol dehydrogenase [Phakopsora pachyrhizi]